MWAGSKDGKIFIISTETYNAEKMLHGHVDAVRAMCAAQTRYVMTGAGSHDGKVAIWRTSAV